MFILSIKLLWGAWRHWDLPLADGAAYFNAGRLVATQFRFRGLELSPLYDLYYALFHHIFLPSEPYLIYFFQRVAFLPIIPVLTYLLLARLVSRPMALLVAIYGATLALPAEQGFVIHAFVLLPVLLTLIAASLDARYQPGLVISASILLWLTRPEFILTVVIVTILSSIRDIAKLVKRRCDARMIFIAWLPVLIGVGAFLLIRARAEIPDTNRSWVAFGQHYSVGYHEQTGASGNPYLDWEAITKADFGAANNIIDAARVNPPAFARHIIWNAGRLIGAVSRTIGENAWNRGSAKSFGWILPFLLIIVITAYLVDRSSFHQAFAGEMAPLTFTILGVITAVLLSGILIYAKASYLLPLISIIFVVTAVALSAFLQPVVARLSWIVAPLAIGLVVLTPSLYPGVGPRPQVEAINAMRSVAPEESFAILGHSAHSYCIYLYQKGCKGINYNSLTPDGLAEAIEANNIRFVVETRAVSDWFREDSYLEQISNPETSGGWRTIYRDPESELVVFFKERSESSVNSKEE